MMRARGAIDALIPRGGAGLINAVVEESRVPVIETGTGNCHVYVDASADLEAAEAIIMNAKTQRVGVCNAAETLLVHADVAERFLVAAVTRLTTAGGTIPMLLYYGLKIITPQFLALIALVVTASELTRRPIPTDTLVIPFSRATTETFPYCSAMVADGRSSRRRG